jgi:RNA polymerase sigma factor (sigma-70 family)
MNSWQGGGFRVSNHDWACLIKELLADSEDSEQAKRRFVDESRKIIYKAISVAAKHYKAKHDGVYISHEDIEDIASEIYVKLWADGCAILDECDPGLSKFPTYLWIIATRTCRDVLDKLYRRQMESLQQPISDTELTLEDILVDSADDPLDAMIRYEELEKFDQCLRRLKTRQRRVIQHRISGRSYQAISEVESISIGRVKSLIHEAKVEMRRVYQNGC